MMLDASLDTSFWNIAAQVGIVPYLFDYFQVHYCQAVEQEIVTTDPQETSLIYPQAILFRLMKESGRLHLVEPGQSLKLFGAGEAFAISLAQERSWVLLLNDYRPLQFALALGLSCITVPDFCLILYLDRKITVQAVKGYINRLRSTTSLKLLREAEAVVDQIAQERGDRI
jgi:predicted nucleic acid-binding protein